MARTDTQVGQLAFLEARHRAHARVEDKIRTAKQAGLGRFPSREFAINAVWLQLALTAADLTAWTQTILLDTTLAKVEPKLLRYRLLCTPPPDHPPRQPDHHQDRRRLALGSPTHRRVHTAHQHPTTPADLYSQPASHCPPTHKDPWRTGPQAESAVAIYPPRARSRSRGPCVRQF